MRNHRIETYHFLDGSVYVARRSDAKRTKENITYNAHTDKAHIKSPLFEACRNGMLIRVENEVITDLSAKESKIHQLAVIRAFESLGIKVLNKKMPKIR